VTRAASPWKSMGPATVLAIARDTTPVVTHGCLRRAYRPCASPRASS